MFIPYLAREPSLVFVPYSIPILVSSSLNDDSEDEKTPLPAHLLLDDSNEHEHAPSLQIHRCVSLTQEADGDVVSVPSDQCKACSKF
jgi:hypothetical protein